jgi:hypothetical protein
VVRHGVIANFARAECSHTPSEKRYSFPVGLMFQGEDLRPAKILGGQRGAESGIQRIIAHWRSALAHYVQVTRQDVSSVDARKWAAIGRYYSHNQKMERKFTHSEY